jgi:hypothetical protein
MTPEINQKINDGKNDKNKKDEKPVPEPEPATVG